MNQQVRPLVLHVIHHLVVGGMENGLINLINHMPSGAYRHAVACIEDFSEFRGRIQRSDVEVVALHRSRIGTNGLRRSLFELCRQWRPAIVHTRNLSGLDGLLPAWLAGVRIAIHGEHGFDVDNLQGERIRPRLLRRLHSPLVDRYITVSRDLESYLTEKIGIRIDRVTRLSNGVDTLRFTPLGESAMECLPESFRGDAIVRIGTVGRLQPVKDQATLLRAFATMLEQKPALRATARLLVIGDGPMHRDLQFLAGALRISELCWFPGAMSDLSRVFRTFDLFVLSSLNEGMSNSILEAMASGVPVVASAVGGNLELVRSEVTGSFFDKGDQAGLARLLSQYVSDADLRLTRGEQARQLAVDDYGLAKMVNGYRKVYDELLSPAS